MPVLREVIEVANEPEGAFDAVADFSSAEGWDPGVVSARRTKDGAPVPVGVGAEYDLTVTFRGQTSRMRYTTIRYERPRVVVLQGVGPNIKAVDTIAFEPTDAGTRIRYEADLRLTGVASLAGPFLSRSFDEMGRRALDGMRAWFERRDR